MGGENDIERANRNETGMAERRRWLETVKIFSPVALAYTCRLKLALGRFKWVSAYIHAYNL